MSSKGRLRTLATLLVLLGALITGCTERGPVPTAPSAAVLVISIIPHLDVLVAPATQAFGVVAVYSDGKSTAVDAAWTSTDERVFTVDAQGRTTTRSAGAAGLIATAQGLTARQDLRVVPDYAGSWQGRFDTTSCVRKPNTGGCAGGYGVGTPTPIPWSCRATLLRCNG